MAVDVGLVLDSGQVVTADGNTTPIDTEGGKLMWACLSMGALSGASTTFDARVQCSIDGGTDYWMIGKHQTFGPTDDSKISKIPVYVRRPITAGNPVKVRMNYDVAGGAPSYAVTRAWLEPILTLAIQNQEDVNSESLNSGGALCMAAT